jgi:hypothetical protein
VKIIALVLKHLVLDMESVNNAKHIIIKEERKLVVENENTKV